MSSSYISLCYIILYYILLYYIFYMILFIIVVFLYIFFSFIILYYIEFNYIIYILIYMMIYTYMPICQWHFPFGWILVILGQVDTCLIAEGESAIPWPFFLLLHCTYIFFRFLHVHLYI